MRVIAVASHPSLAGFDAKHVEREAAVGEEMLHGAEGLASLRLEPHPFTQVPAGGRLRRFPGRKVATGELP